MRFQLQLTIKVGGDDRRERSLYEVFDEAYAECNEDPKAYSVVEAAKEPGIK